MTQILLWGHGKKSDTDLMSCLTKQEKQKEMKMCVGVTCSPDCKPMTRRKRKASQFRQDPLTTVRSIKQRLCVAPRVRTLDLPPSGRAHEHTGLALSFVSEADLCFRVIHVSGFQLLRALTFDPVPLNNLLWWKLEAGLFRFMVAMNDTSVFDVKGSLIEILAINLALPGGKMWWNQRLEWDNKTEQWHLHGSGCCASLTTHELALTKINKYIKSDSKWIKSSSSAEKTLLSSFCSEWDLGTKT